MSTPANPNPLPLLERDGDGATPAAPPPLDVMDTEALRRKLAGLADPATTPGALTPAVVKDLAIRFVSVLASLYNRDALDAVALWERIGSALATADAKCGDDALRFASLCLEHVLAEPGKAAASPALGAVLGTLDAAKDEDRAAFLAYLRNHRYPALAFGRARWEAAKGKEIDL